MTFGRLVITIGLTSGLVVPIVRVPRVGSTSWALLEHRWAPVNSSLRNSSLHDRLSRISYPSLRLIASFDQFSCGLADCRIIGHAVLYRVVEDRWV
jgi:hypothetical protein